jgi:hypothetical protein
MSLIDMSAENNQKNGGFRVDVTDMGGTTISIEGCHNDTSVSYVIEQLRQRLSNIKKRQGITLMMNASLLEPTDTLGDKGIVDGTNLFITYLSILACIRPEPIAPHLYRWIEEGNKERGIEFLPPFKSVETITARLIADAAAGGPPYDPRRLFSVANGEHKSNGGSTRLVEYNRWDWDQEYLFFLTNTQRQYFSMPSIFNGSRVMGENSRISYFSSIHDNKISLKYFPQGIMGRFQKIDVSNYSSIRGTLDGIIIKIDQKEHKIDSGDFSREFHIDVKLMGPIEICEADGTIIASSDYKDAICYVSYDNILMCNGDGEPNMPNEGNRRGNNLAGGRRSKRSKRLKRSKRSQKKRKIRRTYRK